MISAEKAQLSLLADQLHEAAKSLLENSEHGSAVKAGLVGMVGLAAQLQEQVRPEEVEFHHEPEDLENEAPATGWMVLGGVSVCLTRSTVEPGTIYVGLESDAEAGVRVVVESSQSGNVLWKGNV